MQIPFLSDFLLEQANRTAGWFAVGISRQGAHFVCVRRGANKPQVVVCAFHQMPMVDSVALAKMRLDLRVGKHQFTTLLTSGEYQMLMVDAPSVPAVEMKEAIRWRVKDTLSYNVDEATIDVLPIPANQYGGEHPQILYVFAAANSTIQKRMDLFEQAKIRLKVIDTPEMAQRNIAELFEASDQGLALLHFDDTGGLLTFTCNGELYLARRIEITLGQLQDANEKLRQQILNRVELEVQRSLDYFARQYHHIPLQRLLVSAPEQLGLVELLSSNLEVSVESLDLSQVLDITATPELAHGEYRAEVFFTLGAALRQERRAR
jgi:MSHA biogenesis protein MshI